MIAGITREKCAKRHYVKGREIPHRKLAPSAVKILSLPTGKTKSIVLMYAAIRLNGKRKKGY